MASIDLSTLDANLKERKAQGHDLMVKRLTDGWGALGNFRRLRVTDKIALGSLVTKSLMQPGAKGTFNPKSNAIKVQNRWGSVEPAKIDLLIDEKERLALEATYFAEVEGTNGRDPENFWLADHIYELTVEQAGVDTLQATWIGELNSAGTNAVDVVDGIVTLMDEAILSNERPAELVLVHSESNFILTEENILEEVKALVKKFMLELPAYAHLPATLYTAPERITEYKFALENYLKVANSAIYNSHDQQVVWFAKNIKLQGVLALKGTDRMYIEPDGNFVFLTDRRDEKVTLSSDYSVRDRSVALVADWHFSPNFVRADIGVCNDLGVRPVPAPPVTPGDDDEGGA